MCEQRSERLDMDRLWFLAGWFFMGVLVYETWQKLAFKQCLVTANVLDDVVRLALAKDDPGEPRTGQEIEAIAEEVSNAQD
jgi:hypothetical protein